MAVFPKCKENIKLQNSATFSVSETSGENTTNVLSGIIGTTTIVLKICNYGTILLGDDYAWKTFLKIVNVGNTAVT